MGTHGPPGARRSAAPRRDVKRKAGERVGDAWETRGRKAATGPKTPSADVVEPGVVCETQPDPGRLKG